MCDFILDGRSIMLPCSRLCRVQTMPPEVRAIHHITFEQCRDCEPFDPNEILLWPCDAFAAHNSAFEAKFCPALASKPVICTYKAALRVWPDAPGHGNFALYYWLQDQGSVGALGEIQAHRAGPDAYVTAHLLRALFDAGHTGREMVAWTKEPALLPRCPIGKFRGMAWSEVDAGFLGWMLRQPDMGEDLRWNAEREIARRSEGG